MSQARALLIINRKSRCGSADLAAALRVLEAQGLQPTTEYAEGAGQFESLIERHRGEIDRLIIGGGDGTMNCAARALVEADLPVGILPMGTANDLARSLGIPADPARACETIGAGRLRRIDLGQVNGVYFFNAASIGLGAEVTRNLTSEVKSRWGAWGYARTVYDAVKTARSFSATITCDGHTEDVRSIQIAVGNGRYYGGGMSIAHDASIDDERLDLYSLKPISFWQLLKLTPALRAGHHRDLEAVLVLHGREIEVHTRRSKSVTTDGELTTRTPARFRIVPKALSVYVPQDAP
jgi:YegS/Rv2252/BmrU family lipid kinase